jgi:hypothetical protein
MTRRTQSLTPVVAAAVAVFILAAPAFAKEPPSRGGVEGGYLNAKGVVGPASMMQPPRSIVGSPGTHSVYVTQPADDGTALARVDTSGQDPVRTRIIDDGYSIPTVALDKSTSGLSADGSRLVLARPLAGLGQRRTEFETLDGRSLRVQQVIGLPGAFSFDAISPNGNRLYLIEYTSPQDPTEYLVRAYDLNSDRMLKAPVIDPDEAGRPMTGKPVTRTVSSSGRWAYTLYKGSDEGPFVHALDTMKGQAVCVDLVGLVTDTDLRKANLVMSPDGTQLTVSAPGEGPLATINTETLEASAPREPGSGGDGIPWMLIAVAAAVGLGAGGAIIASRHRHASGLATPDA